MALSGTNRTDIRTSVGSASGTAPGLRFKLTITLFISGLECAALSGYVIYNWHCMHDGLYSSGTTPHNYLRGTQVTHANG